MDISAECNAVFRASVFFLSLDNYGVAKKVSVAGVTGYNCRGANSNWRMNYNFL